MKKVTKLLAAFLMAGLAACSNNDEADSPVLPDDPQAQASVYMNVAVQLPTGTKSQTLPGGGSSDNTEQGKDYENTVNTILLVLADKDNGYIAHGSVGGLNTPTGKNPTVSATTAINRTTLSAFYEKHKADANTDWTEINVYAFCNPTQELVDIFDNTDHSDWMDKSCEVIETPNRTGSKNVTIWSKGSFLMSNAAQALREIPQNFEDWSQNYDTEENPFHLSSTNDEGSGIDNSATKNRGAISVERSVARFDFKDGSPSETDANTYVVQKTATADGTLDGDNLQVELVRMAMVNMSKNFYYLRRTSDNGLNNGANAKICGLETDENYVVDTDADAPHKSTATVTPATLSTYYNYCLFNESGDIIEQTRNQWDNYKISVVTGQEEDNDEDWNAGDNANVSKDGYRIWRYVTENTIPGTQDNGGQKKGVSTGIVFKGKLRGGKDMPTDSKLYAAINGSYELPEGKQGYTYKVDNKNYPILYLFDNVLYVGWNDQIVSAAETAAEGSPLYNAVFNKPTKNGTALEKSPNELYQELVAASGDQASEALSKFREAATAAGFTLYQASADADFGAGYYFYYYYWNRHNDNGLSGTMGPMEFAVVRNNVYKLAVTEIKQLGHPRISDNDPDPEKPDEPDEEGDVYLSVSVQVLPWVVRINNIVL